MSILFLVFQFQPNQIPVLKILNILQAQSKLNNQRLDIKQQTMWYPSHVVIRTLRVLIPDGNNQSHLVNIHQTHLKFTLF